MRFRLPRGDVQLLDFDTSGLLGGGKPAITVSGIEEHQLLA